MTIQVPVKLILAATALIALTASASADWRSQISDYDPGRLPSRDQSRAHRMPQAQTRRATGHSTRA